MKVTGFQPFALPIADKAEPERRGCGPPPGPRSELCRCLILRGGSFRHNSYTNKCASASKRVRRKCVQCAVIRVPLGGPTTGKRDLHALPSQCGAN